MKIILFTTILTAILFQGCVTKTHYSPEIEAIVIDIETLKPIENVKVVNMQRIGIYPDDLGIHNTEQSLSNKDGCLHIDENDEYIFILFPFVGVMRTDTSLTLKHPDYRYEQLIVQSLSNNEYQSYVFGMCKKSSTTCNPAKWSYYKYKNKYYYEDDLNEYLHRKIYKKNNENFDELLKKRFKTEEKYDSFKFSENFINNCLIK